MTMHLTRMPELTAHADWNQRTFILTRPLRHLEPAGVYGFGMHEAWGTEIARQPLATQRGFGRVISQERGIQTSDPRTSVPPSRFSPAPPHNL